MVTELEFGKKIRCGNFYVLKKARSLSKADLKVLRDAQGIPDDVRKCLQRASLPYIKVSTLSENWSVEFVIGLTMYHFIDSCDVTVGEDGKSMIGGKEGSVMESIFVQMMADTTVVGDKDYRIRKAELMQEYLDREAKRRNEESDAGKSEEELRKESEEAVQEVIDRDEHAKMLLEMGEDIKKEEKGGGNG